MPSSIPTNGNSNGQYVPPGGQYVPPAGSKPPPLDTNLPPPPPPSGTFTTTRPSVVITATTATVSPGSFRGFGPNVQNLGGGTFNPAQQYFPVNNDLPNYSPIFAKNRGTTVS